MMKKVLTIALLGSLLMAFNSCNDKKDPETGIGEMTLNFKGYFDQQPLTMLSSEYDYEDGIKVKFQLFQFYVSSIRLIDEDGQVGPELKDVALISFGDVQDMAKAAEGVDLVLENVPVGNYSGVQLGIGVNNALNSTTPNQYAAGHPLSGHYWEAASSYIFTKIEGNADTDSDEEFEQKLTFHIGTDPSYREVTFNKTFTVGTSENESFDFQVDVKDIFVSQSDFVDFRQVTQIHDGSAPIAVAMMDRFSLALKLEE